MPVAASRAPRVLLVDDEPDVTQGIRLALRKESLAFECAGSGTEALDLLDQGRFDVVVSDEQMPGMAGSQLLSIVRERHPGVVRIILSGQASLGAALRAINGAEIYRFLLKPCPPEELALTIRQALVARDERRGIAAWETEQRAAAPARKTQVFERFLASLWVGFQPIVSRTGELYGYEALLRSDDPEWKGPLLFLSAAREVGRTQEVGRRVRALVAERLADAPEGSVVAVNVSPEDLLEEDLIEGSDTLAQHAHRVILEITERESLSSIEDVDARVRKLRAAGYRIAVDDFGSGYSGLNSVVALVPDVVKFDMELLHGIDRSPTKQQAVGPIVAMGHSLGMRCLAEGIETQAEHDTALELGFDLLQGYFHGKATRGFEGPANVRKG